MLHLCLTAICRHGYNASSHRPFQISPRFLCSEGIDRRNKIMVLKEVLQRHIASLLRPWLQQEAALELELGILRCDGSIRRLYLDVSALNSALMESSPLIMQQARVESLNAVLLPWRHPVLTVEIRGLHIVMSPRLADDEFWESCRERWTDEQEWKAALRCIDPQGAAAHAAAERVVNNESSSNWCMIVLANMALQCARIELHDVSIELRMSLKDFAKNRSGLGEDNGFYSSTFRLKSFIIEDGFCGQNRLPGGFLGAAISSVLYSYRGTKASKTCNVAGLGVELKRPESRHSHFLVVYDNYVIFLRELIVLFKLKHHQLTDLEVSVPEVSLGLYPRDWTELTIILKHFDSIAAKAVASGKTRQQVEESKQGRSGEELWRRAWEKTVRITPRHRLQQLVKTGMLRQHYARTYESWLREVGWGLKNGSILSTSKLAKSKQLSHSIEKLWRKVCDIEKELPVEAVALARRVARHRVLACPQRDDIEALKISFREQIEAQNLSLVSTLFSSLFGCLWKLIRCICAFILSLFGSMINLLCSFSPFNNKVRPSQPADDRYAVTIQTSCISEHSQEFFDVSGPCYRLNFCKASLTIACDDVSEVFVKGSKNEGAGLSGMVGPSVCVLLEHLCLEYVSDENATELGIVCGEFKGQMFSNAYNEQLSQRDKKFGKVNFHNVFRHGIGGYTSNHETETFLWSSPAPQIHSLNENGIANVGGSISNTWNMIMENHQAQLWSNWEKKFMKHKVFVGTDTPTSTEKPFFLCEFKSVLFDPSVKASNSGILKCGVSVGKLVCDLECSAFAYIGLLLLQLLDTSRASDNGAEKLPFNSSDGAASSSVSRDIGWEVLYDSYMDKMKHALQTIVPDKNIQLTAAIAGPKIQLSASSQEFLRLWKKTTHVESHSKVSVIIDLGKLEVAIWPATQIGTLVSAGEQNMHDRSKIEHVWLRRPPLSNLFAEFTTDTYTGHERIGNNAYVKLENAIVLLENKSENRQLPLVKPLTVIVQSSVCR